MTATLFVIGALATYRITVLFVRDAGPFDVFKRLRKVARCSKLLSCPFCVSMWVAALIETGYILSGIRDSAVVMVCTVFAFSAIAIICDRTWTSDFKT